MDAFFKLLHGETATVRVGQGVARREFVVSKDLLCAKSKWFDNAFKDERFVEGRTGIIDMPEDVPDAFQAFYYFLITGSILHEGFMLVEEKKGRYGEQVKRVYECWIFGDKYGDSRLQNAAVVTACLLLSKATWKPPTLNGEHLTLSFSETMAGSPLRAITADYVAARMAINAAGASQLLQALCPFDGFTEALQESQGLLHHSRNGDFPRYLKPRKHTDLLAALPPKVIKDGSTIFLLPASDQWTFDYTRCWECGFNMLRRDIKMAGDFCIGGDESQRSSGPICKKCVLLLKATTFEETRSIFP